MAQIPSFDETILRAICNVLGDTSTGLTGSEIGQVLRDCRIDDPNPTDTKRYRLYEALSQRQNRDHYGNQVAAFLLAAMKPVRYVRDRHLFDTRREALNQVLSFVGLTLGEDGQLRQVTTTRTISEARERASRLRRALLDRQVHPDVLRFCREELLQDNYFHAVFEATKSVADKIRERSGLKGDGAQLVDDAFGGNLPLLAFNSLQTPTERSEHIVLQRDFHYYETFGFFGVALGF